MNLKNVITEFLLLNPKTTEMDEETIAKLRHDKLVAFAYGPKLTKLSDVELRRRLINLALGTESTEGTKRWWKKRKKEVNPREDVVEQDDCLPEGIERLEQIILNDSVLLEYSQRTGTLFWLFTNALNATDMVKDNTSEPDSIAIHLGFPKQLLIKYFQAIFGGMKKELNTSRGINDLVAESIGEDDMAEFLTAFYKLLGLDDDSSELEIRRRCELFKQKITRLKKMVNSKHIENIQEIQLEEKTKRRSGVMDEKTLREIVAAKGFVKAVPSVTEPVDDIMPEAERDIAKERSIYEDLATLDAMIKENTECWARSIDPFAPTTIQTIDIPLAPPVASAQSPNGSTPAPTDPTSAEGTTRAIDQAELESNIAKLKALLEHCKTLNQGDAEALYIRINQTNIARYNGLGDVFILDESNDPLKLLREHFELERNTANRAELEAKLEATVMEVARQFTKAKII
jgi:hypothetical protein